jgi:hypothetical protein
MSFNNQMKKNAEKYLPEINSGGTDSILASMFRSMIESLGINHNRQHHLMNMWLNDPKNGIPRNIKDQSSARGNLQKELFKTKMSWKVFCKGLRFLNIVRFELVIRAHHSGGKITEHTKAVNLGNMQESSEDTE